MLVNIRKRIVVIIIMILVLTIADNLFSKKQQCLGITKKGIQCKRFVEVDPPYCYQHSKDYKIKKRKKKSLKSTIAKGFYKVHRVTDGDTFWVDINRDGKATKDEKVRLLGVDTFETRVGKRLKRQAEKWNISVEKALELGEKAKKFAIEKLLNKEVQLEYSGARVGGYGRVLAYIIVDGEDFGSMLLEKGLAFVYRKNKRHAKYEDYLKLERL